MARPSEKSSARAAAARGTKPRESGATESGGSASGAGEPRAGEPGARREQIERNLKRVYDETLQEPLPDELAALLERLKQQGRK